MLRAPRLVLENVRKLAAHGLITMEGEDGFILNAAQPGRLMAHHYISLPTMINICGAPSNSHMTDLLRVIATAQVSLTHHHYLLFIRRSRHFALTVMTAHAIHQ